MRSFFKVKTAPEVLESLKDINPLGVQPVSITNALSRVLARDIVSTEDIPGFQRSTVDGYALDLVEQSLQDAAAALGGRRPRQHHGIRRPGAAGWNGGHSLAAGVTIGGQIELGANTSEPVPQQACQSFRISDISAMTSFAISPASPVLRAARSPERQRRTG